MKTRRGDTNLIGILAIIAMLMYGTNWVLSNSTFSMGTTLVVPAYLEEATLDLTYSPIAHNHDLDYSDIAHDHDADYSDIAHDHDADYMDISTSRKQIMGASKLTALASDNTAQYASPNDMSTATTATYAYMVMPISGTLSDLSVKLVTAPENGGGTQTRVISVYMPSSATALTLTFSEAENGLKYDNTHTVNVVQGDLVCISFTATNTPSASICNWGLCFTPS